MPPPAWTVDQGLRAATRRPRLPRGEDSVTAEKAMLCVITVADSRRTNDRPTWLERHGAWLLLVFSVAVVAVAATVDRSEAVGSILAFAGVATFVIGVLLSRLEGSLEIGPTKVVANLRALAKRDDLTSTEILNLFQRSLDIRGDPVPVSAGPQGIVGPPNAPALPEIPPFHTATGEDAAFAGQVLGVAFEAHVAAAFRADDWAVDIRRRRVDFGFDFEATKGQGRVLVEVKLRRRISAADVHSFIGAVLQRDEPAETRYAYVVNAGALSAAARRELARVPRISVVDVTVIGW
jgi:hypothetical protein